MRRSLILPHQEVGTVRKIMSAMVPGTGDRASCSAASLVPAGAVTSRGAASQ